MLAHAVSTFIEAALVTRGARRDELGLAHGRLTPRNLVLGLVLRSHVAGNVLRTPKADDGVELLIDQSGTQGNLALDLKPTH
jgi:hypothetical protein